MECRGSFPVVKCTYCRSEFQQENGASKTSSATICKKCEANVAQYGKPSACEYCNIIAAFIGAKCQRCHNSEKKFGPPQTCEQCKQKCAFDRRDDSKKKVDGKLLCWLCTLAYKRALAKAKANDPLRHSSLSLHKSSSGHRSSSTREKLHHSSKHGNSSSSSSNNNNNGSSASPAKKPRLDPGKVNSNGVLPLSATNSPIIDPNSSDHLVAVTQLKEQITQLQKQLHQKDQQLITKEKQLTELKAHQFQLEKDLRTKMQNAQRDNQSQIEQLQNKLRNLQKQVGTLSKGKSNNKVDSPQINL